MNLDKFFNTNRVNHYTIRLKSSSLIIILISALQIILWANLDFYKIDERNTILVYATNSLTILLHIFNFIKFMVIHKIQCGNIVDKTLCIFYSMLISFFVNVIQTLMTLFGSYLNYFQGTIF